jgi:hypothetical protein
MDSEFEQDLRDALRREATRPSLALDGDDLRSMLQADEHRRRARRRWELVGGVAVAGLAVAAVALWPRIQWTPSGGGPTQAPCVESAPTTHGTWWVEIGGPHAYFNVAPGTLYATDNPWKIIVRFDPDAAQGQTVAMSAEAVPSGERVDGSLNSRMNPSNIYHFASPAPNLPGGWYLFEQRLPTAGCWRLSASIDGRIVGSATLSVVYGASSPPTTSAGPTPGSAGSADASPTTFSFDVENRSSIGVIVSVASDTAATMPGFEPGQRGTISIKLLNPVNGIGVEIQGTGCRLLASEMYPTPGSFTLVVDDGAGTGTVKLSTEPKTAPQPIPLPSNSLVGCGG